MPSVSMRPDMIPARVARASASSMLCVVRTVLRSAEMAARVFHMTRLDAASRPLEGSSRSKTDGFPIRAMARDSLRLVPPDSFCARR